MQVRLNGELASRSRSSGPSALLSVLTAADGYVIVPEDANGLSGRRDRRSVAYG